MSAACCYIGAGRVYLCGWKEWQQTSGAGAFEPFILPNPLLGPFAALQISSAMRDVGEASRLDLDIRTRSERLQRYDCCAGEQCATEQLEGVDITLTIDCVNLDNLKLAFAGQLSELPSIPSPASGLGISRLAALVKCAREPMALLFEGINAVDGSQVFVFLRKVKFGVAKNRRYLSDDFAEITLTGSLLQAQGRPSAASAPAPKIHYFVPAAKPANMILANGQSTAGCPLAAANFGATVPNLYVPPQPTITTFATGVPQAHDIMKIPAGSPFAGYYLTTASDDTVKLISPSGAVATFSTGHSGPAFVMRIASGALAGNFLVSNSTTQTLRLVLPSGGISFGFATGINGCEQMLQIPAGNPFAGDFLVCAYYSDEVMRVPAAGGAALGFSSSIVQAAGIMLIPPGSPFAGDYLVSSDTPGEILRIPAAGGAPVLFAAGLTRPRGLRLVTSGIHAGSYAVAALTANAIQILSPAGAVSTFVGGFNLPIAFEDMGDGHYLVADYGSDSIKKISPASLIGLPYVECSLDPAVSGYAALQSDCADWWEETHISAGAQPEAAIPLLGRALHLDASVAASWQANGAGQLQSWTDLVNGVVFAAHGANNVPPTVIPAGADAVFGPSAMSFIGVGDATIGPGLIAPSLLNLGSDVTVFAIGRGIFLNNGYTNVPFYLGSDANPFVSAGAASDVFATQGLFNNPASFDQYSFTAAIGSGALAATGLTPSANHFNYSLVSSAASNTREQRCNGVVIASSASGAIGNFNVQFLMPLTQLAHNSAILAEIIVYNRQLSPAEIAQVETYLQAKWL